MAISLEDVKEAVDTLKKEGESKPSAGKVRALLGTGGMGTIQKYLKEIRNAEVTEEVVAGEQQQVEAVEIDQAMVEGHVKTIIEHVATATRSAYLQQLIDLDAKASGLEAELAETKQNYEELASDFEQSSADMAGVESAMIEANQNIEQLKRAQIDAAASFDENLAQVKLEHKNEVLALKAANKQLEKVIDSITKRIGVVEQQEG